MYTTLDVSRPRDGVLLVTLDRPDRLNAITFEMFDELHDLCRSTRVDETVRAVVVTGAGRGFCSGLDLDEAATLPSMTPQQMYAGQEHWAGAFEALHDLPQPVIAAVNGPAAGGGLAIALASDIRLCSTEAKFGTAFIRLGLSGCDIGVSWLLPRLIGASRAWELMLTGRVFDATEADKLGLVTRVVEPDQLLDEAYAVAELIKGNSPMGTWMTKEVMWSNLETGSLQAGIDLENRTQIMTSATEDCRAAMGGFLSRQQVEWQNR